MPNESFLFKWRIRIFSGIYDLLFWMIIITFVLLLLIEPRLLENEHPLKLLLLIDFVIIMTWTMDSLFSSENHSVSRERIWVILSILFLF